LIILGPKKLPEIARALGRGLGEFRRATQDIKESMLSEDHPAGARPGRSKIKEAPLHSRSKKNESRPDQAGRQGPSQTGTVEETRDPLPEERTKDEE